MHSELGAIGGGHHDPGVLYPIDRVISYALELSPDVRKQKVWKAHLTTARAMLKSLLAIRARMRQNHLEQRLRPDDPTAERASQDHHHAQATDPDDGECAEVLYERCGKAVTALVEPTGRVIITLGGW
jgi:hypothetical protein